MFFCSHSSHCSFVQPLEKALSTIPCAIDGQLKDHTTIKQMASSLTSNKTVGVT